jgi:hypothetical protein
MSAYIKYAVKIGTGGMINIPSFIKIDTGVRKLFEGIL